MKRLPKVGTEVIGYKKVLVPDPDGEYRWPYFRGIAQLVIPADAQRVRGWGGYGKCRAEYAYVTAIAQGRWCSTRWEYGDLLDVARSAWDEWTRYVVGEIVRPDVYDPDPREVCSSGIHFYLTVEEAENR